MDVNRPSVCTVKAPVLLGRLSGMTSLSGEPPSVLGAPGSWSRAGGSQRSQHVQHTKGLVKWDSPSPSPAQLTWTVTMHVDNSEPMFLDKKAEA